MTVVQAHKKTLDDVLEQIKKYGYGEIESYSPSMDDPLKLVLESVMLMAEAELRNLQVQFQIRKGKLNKE